MRQKPVMEIRDYDRLVAAAEEAALANDWRVSIAVVDDGGWLIGFRRMDGAAPFTTDIAQDKARSAALSRRPTVHFQDLVTSGRSVLEHLAHVVPIEGGAPIIADGTVVGGVGVSGAQSAQDAVVVAAGLKALEENENART